MKIVQPVRVVDATLIASNVDEADYSAWDATVSYVTGDRVIYVNASLGIHEIWEAADDNSGLDPHFDSSDPAKWVLVGATNRWLMFDGTVTAQTTRGSTIDVTLYPVEPVDTVAMFNVEAASVELTMTDPAAGVVYSKTTSLVDPVGITDWYGYFYEATAFRTDWAATDLPRYAGATLRVVVTSPEYAKVGELVIGRAKKLGGIRTGAGVGIMDYTVKQADDWGTYQIVERPFSKRMECQIFVWANGVDALQTLLTGYRAQPIVYIGADAYGSTLIYGFLKDWQIELSYPTFSVCNVTIEGLT